LSANSKRYKAADTGFFQREPPLLPALNYGSAMNELLELLHTRNSAPRLTQPGPDAYSLEQMFKAALRAPDHAWLQPWRFIAIEGEGREELGEVFADALKASTPTVDEAALAKARMAPLRAPLIVIVVCKVVAHPKVPRDEQLLSAGCAAQGMLLAAEAQGYAGVWRTGAYAVDRFVHEALGMATDEEIVGFLYFGTREGASKTLPTREVKNYVTYWRA
jgi:nitroreductase